MISFLTEKFPFFMSIELIQITIHTMYEIKHPPIFISPEQGVPVEVCCRRIVGLLLCCVVLCDGETGKWVSSLI